MIEILLDIYKWPCYHDQMFSKQEWGEKRHDYSYCQTEKNRSADTAASLFNHVFELNYLNSCSWKTPMNKWEAHQYHDLIRVNDTIVTEACY